MHTHMSQNELPLSSQIPNLGGLMRYLVIIFSVLLVLLCLHQAQARIIHVPADSSTIQKGINGAVNGDTVLVAPGIYYEHIDFNGKNILLKSEAGAQNTILEKATTGVPIVKIRSGENRQCIIDGFNIRRAFNGHGIYCENSSPIITNNILEENLYEGDGAALRLINTSVLVTHNIFRRNSATYGSAIHSEGSGSDSILYNTIVDNTAAVSAVRFLFKQSSVFAFNLVYENGDYTVLLEEANYIKLVNNTIARNSCPNGAVALATAHYADLRNNIVCNNGGIGLHP